MCYYNIYKTKNKIMTKIKTHTLDFIKKYNVSLSILLIGVIIIISQISIIHYKGSGNKAIIPYDPTGIFNDTLLDNKGKIFGPDDAKIIVVKYTDTECPFCKRLHQDVMLNIKKDYPNVGVYYSYLPFHANSAQEMKSIYCVQKYYGDKYFDFVDNIFKTTQGNNSLTLDNLLSIETSLGMDTDKITTCMKDKDIEDKLQAQSQDGADKEVNGTPQTYVLIKDGIDYVVYNKISGARDYNYFKKVLDKAIEETK